MAKRKKKTKAEVEGGAAQAAANKARMTWRGFMPARREGARLLSFPSTAQSLHALGAQLYAQDDFAGALPLFERALAIHEKEFGSEHPDTAMIVHNLALVLYAQDDFAGAQPLLERALAIREKELGSEHPDTARSLHRLALALHEQGDLTGAPTLFERALAVH